MPEITVNGARVAYVESRTAGTGPAALLLHSSASSGRQWRALMALLAGTFATTAPDLWGYGATDPWPGPGPLTLAGEAAALETFVAGAGQPVHLVGHSYGAAVALALALEHPTKCASLTLYEPVAFYLLRGGDADDAGLLDEVRAVAGAMAAAHGRGEDAAAMAGFVEYWNAPGAWAALSADRQAELARRTAKVVQDFGALFDEPTRLSAYRALTMPALVMRGADSPPSTRRIAARLAGALGDARLVEIAGAGHMAPLTDPDQVNAAIRAHLDQTTLRKP